MIKELMTGFGGVAEVGRFVKPLVSLGDQVRDFTVILEVKYQCVPTGTLNSVESAIPQSVKGIYPARQGGC